MNRAARRQQKKLSRTAVSRARGQPPRAEGVAARGAPADYVAQLVQRGFQLQVAGQAREAAAVYRQVLQSDPTHADANHLLGILALQSGDTATAEELISRAIASDGAQPIYHNNLGSVLGKSARLEDAAASYRAAVGLKPDYAEAHYNLADVSKELGRLDEAIAGYRQAIAAKPDYADAHFKLGFALHQSGRLDAAAESYRDTLALEPNYADAHGNLGAIRQATGRSNEAFAHCRNAVALKPDFDPFWNGLAISLETVGFSAADDAVLRDLLRLLERPRVSPNLIARPIVSALHAHPRSARALELMRAGSAQSGTAALDAAAGLSAVPLFLRLLALSIINDPDLERRLTQIRRALILEMTGAEPAAEGTADKGLPFLAALALHCFTNEYVFVETAEETEAVGRLGKRIGTLLEAGEDVPPAQVAILGAYRPLCRLDCADALRASGRAGVIGEVIARQIDEPGEEQALRGGFACLTPIDDAVSKSVRRQYEENPYPRWVKTILESNPRSIGEVLRSPPLDIDVGAFDPDGGPDILVAGCGTGQHAVTTAANFRDARILAVDLSLASLGYAARKARELGYSGIEFAQADIMELGRLERRFDLVESAGVLHHLADPMAGWRILVDLLRPGGIMKIALYSEIARQPVVAARALIAEKGYSATPEGIRECRQEILRMAEAGNQAMAGLAESVDFYGLSMCRDLIFHVQEHRFTLPRIEAALASLGLEFLGFELADPDALRRFKAANPDPAAMASLAIWHAFEVENPNTFRRMYQFWCRKR